MSDADSIVEGKPWALMGYLWILCLIPLVMKKDNAFALFHAKQGLLLFLCSMVCSVIAIVPILGFIGVLGNLIILIMYIFGLFNVILGKYWKIPIVGNIAKNLDF
jgi:uncharacterized membrane protein